MRYRILGWWCLLCSTLVVLQVAAQEDTWFCEPPVEEVVVTEKVDCDDHIQDGVVWSDALYRNNEVATPTIALPTNLPKTWYSIH
jgi:hypothetical protein